MNAKRADNNKTGTRHNTQDGSKTMRMLTTTVAAGALTFTLSLGLAGIDGTGYTVGAVEKIASVFVNGVKYETATAQVWVDGEPASEAQIQVGQIVGVLGQVNADGVTGRADAVYLDYQVIGPVDELSDSHVTVLEQQILVNDATVLAADIDGFSLSSLSLGDRVAVSGRRLADGRLLASWIGRASAGQPLTLLGRATAVNSAWRRFEIDGMKIGYGFAQLNGLAWVADGDLVQVTGLLRFGDQLLAGSVRAVGNQEPVAVPVAADHCVAGVADEVDADDGELRIDGTLVRVGQTRLVDHSVLAIRRFDLGHVADGDYLRACGQASNGGLAAALLARLPAQAEGLLKGRARLVGDNEVEILGRRVNLPAANDPASGWLRVLLSAGATPRVSVALDQDGQSLSAQLVDEDPDDDDDADEDAGDDDESEDDED